ncbi:MAG: hypothetical protein FWG10_04445 [Eubacteriaceae bacterium]|nr:hypothetical protein [Eubacteriaceae bacterium]
MAGAIAYELHYILEKKLQWLPGNFFLAVLICFFPALWRGGRSAPSGLSLETIHDGFIEIKATTLHFKCGLWLWLASSSIALLYFKNCLSTTSLDWRCLQALP